MNNELWRGSRAGSVAAISAALAIASIGVDAAGHRGGGGGGRAASHGGGGGGGHANAGNRPQVNTARADVRTNNVRSTSVNNVNRTNVNVNRNVNVDVDRGCCNGWDNDYHPIATAAAVTATVAVTSAVVGSMVRTLPPACAPINYQGMIYQQCGSTWYVPQGPQYVVVAPPY